MQVHGYDSELEYLDDQFATLVQRIQVAAEIWGDMGRYGEMVGDTGKIQGRYRGDLCMQVAAEVQKRRVKQAEVEENAAPWEKAR